MKAIKLLQYATIAYIILFVIGGAISLFVNEWTERYVKILGALAPFVIPQIVSAFGGNPLKKYIEGRNGKDS